MHPEIKQRVDLIRRDRSRGARELTLEALKGITDFLDHWGETDSAGFYNQLRDLLDELAEARPSMIPVMNAMVTLRNELKPRTPVVEQKAVIRKTIDEIKVHTRTALEQIIEQGLQFFRKQEFNCILTHSYSSTVVAFLKAAGVRKYIRKVIVTESRPLYEGVSLARELTKSMEIMLITEAQVAHFIRECKAVILGADAIGKDHTFINKVGSRQISLCARWEHIPVILMAETMKVHPRQNAAEIVKEEMSPEELGHDLPAEVSIRNVYFETVDRDLVDYWISEEGVLLFTGTGL